MKEEERIQSGSNNRADTRVTAFQTGRRSSAWRDLETAVAVALGGARITTRWDLFQVRDDVRVPDFPHWRIDAKYRAKSEINTRLNVIRQKYCGDADVPICVTKCHRENGAVVSLPLSEFARLLGEVRALRAKEGNTHV